MKKNKSKKRTLASYLDLDEDCEGRPCNDPRSKTKKVKDNTRVAQNKIGMKAQSKEEKAAAADLLELRATGTVKKPKSVRYQKKKKPEATIKPQDSRTSKQRKKDHEIMEQDLTLERGLIYLDDPLKLVGDALNGLDLGTDLLPDSEEDRLKINRSRATSADNAWDRAKPYMSGATLNTALGTAFAPTKGLSTKSVLNEIVNPLANLGIWDDILYAMAKGLHIRKPAKLNHLQKLKKLTGEELTEEAGEELLNKNTRDYRVKTKQSKLKDEPLYFEGGPRNLSEKEVSDIVQDEIDYLKSPEYLETRMANTGESKETVLKEIDTYLKNMDLTTISQESRRGNTGSYALNNPGIIPKLLGMKNEPYIRFGVDNGVDLAKNTLRHEVNHGLSPTSVDNFKAYKNYPSLDVGDVPDRKYLMRPDEQQVRFNKIKTFMRDSFGIKKGQKFTDENIDQLLSNKATGFSNGKYEDGYQFVQMTRSAAKDDNTYRKSLREALNNSWAALPAAGVVGAAASEQKPNDMKKQKLALGGSVKGYMKHPHEVLTENRINIAKAQEEVASDGVLNTMDDIGKMAINWGVNNGGVDALMGMGQNLIQGNKINQGLAMGGTSKTQNVNVDDGEILETPDGKISKVKGDPNEVDGVNANLPIGTKVFSDMVEKHGQTMAERKLQREKRLAKLAKMLEKKPKDSLVKKSYKRVKSQNDKEEAEDMAIQEQMSAMNNMLKNVEGFFTGGIVDGPDDPTDPNDPFGQGTYMKNDVGDVGENDFNSAVVGEGGSPDPVNVSMEMSDVGEFDSEKGGFDLSSTLTGGDILGLAGNFHAMNKLKKNTMNSRATDTPNVNAFKEFGKDGMETMDKSMDKATEINDHLKQEIRQNAGASKRSGRIGARGMQTQRANDLAVDQGANDALGKASAQFAQQMMQMFGKKAQMQMMQDRMVMQGEDMRDIRDRADKDAHYTNMSQDIASYAEGLQQTGKDLNAIEQNQIMMNLIKQMSNYFNMDAKGNISNQESE